MPGIVGYQPDILQQGEQRREAGRRRPGPVGQHGDRPRPLLDMAKEFEVEGGEQGTGGHETICDAGNVADVGQRRHDGFSNLPEGWSAAPPQSADLGVNERSRSAVNGVWISTQAA